MAGQEKCGMPQGMTPLAMSLCIQRATFKEYADKEDKTRMSKAAFLKMVKAELPLFEDAEKAFQLTDRDQSKCVDFCEFSTLLCVCANCHNEICEQLEKTYREEPQSCMWPKDKGDCQQQQK